MTSSQNDRADGPMQRVPPSARPPLSKVYELPVHTVTSRGFMPTVGEILTEQIKALRAGDFERVQKLGLAVQHRLGSAQQRERKVKA